MAEEHLVRVQISASPFIIMSYEIYKRIMNKEEYFKSWDSDSYKALTEELRNQIYHKYVIKSKVLIRDNFSCQQYRCAFCKNEKYYKNLTVHHVVARRNGGEDKEDNEVTLCHTIHQRYEKAKDALILSNEKHLPLLFRGKTFKLEKPSRTDWKLIKKEMKVLRKTLKGTCHITLTTEQWNLIMRFIFIQIEDD